MNKEILFRAKHKEWNEWVEGDLIHEPFGVCIQFIKDGCKSIIKVDPKTVCQYTGLNDKNGKKIFEGDIIRKKVNLYKLRENIPCGERMLIGNVIWDDSSLIYVGNWTLKANDEFGNVATYTFDNKYEVIGNIFDNPELLETKGK